jgi:hypothetical protein
MKAMEKPKKVGGIAVHYAAAHIFPRRVGANREELEFPIRDGMQMHLLADGVQMLVFYPVFGWQQEPAVFFAGMDESPFLTRLVSRAHRVLEEEGEKPFYDALQPASIKRAKKKFPDALARRQGDIWGIPVPFSWYVLTPRGANERAQWLEHLSPSTPKSVLRTNHRIQGKYGPLRRKWVGDLLFEKVGVGEGVITAPDHAPQDWKGNPHIIDRTDMLHPTARNPSGQFLENGLE